MTTRLFLVSSLTVFVASAAYAAEIDMNDPHRAVGRENDVRIDAQLASDVVQGGAPIAVTYQVHNLTDRTVGLAEKNCSASYDPETQTITIALGSEIPPDGALPRMAVIAPGEKKIFRAAATVHSAIARAARLTPRFVQIKVSLLRNILPFRELIDRQQRPQPPAVIPLSDAQFEEWLDENDTIYLNSLPVRFEKSSGSAFDASQSRSMPGSR